MERRAYERYPVQLEVVLKRLDAPGDDIAATVIDVSYGGVGIITSTALQSGTQISIEWINPQFYYDGKPVAVGAIVDIVKPEQNGNIFRIGIQFSEKNSDLIQSLLNWIHMQARAQANAKRFSGQQKRVRF